MDHLSSTILMCAILVLFYASGTVKGAVALDDTCTTTAGANACTITDAECRDDGSGLKCLCKTTHYKNSADCTARKKPTEGCAADQCVANATCKTSDNACHCNTHYIATPTSSPTSCKSTGFGATCSDNAGCTQTNNVCNNTKCACSDGSFRNLAGNACLNKVDVNDSCSSTETSTLQCSNPNSACSSDGASGHNCYCKSAYYDASGTCTPRKKPDEGCGPFQCVANAMCIAPGNKCACNAGYIATPTSSPTSCKSSDAATIMLAHMHVFIFGTVASLYFLV